MNGRNQGAVLSKTGVDGGTESAEGAAELLLAHRWKPHTWANRSRQIKKWLVFRAEDGRDPLPAGEGDVLAYLGYLYLEGRVGATSCSIITEVIIYCWGRLLYPARCLTVRTRAPVSTHTRTAVYVYSATVRYEAHGLTV